MKKVELPSPSPWNSITGETSYEFFDSNYERVMYAHFTGVNYKENKRLIESAPELLNALIECWLSMEHMDSMDEAKEQAKLAINKALNSESWQQL